MKPESQGDGSLDRELDRQLRRRLEPPSSRVRRVIAAAYQGDRAARERPRRHAARLGWAVAATAVIFATSLYLRPPAATEPRPPTPRRLSISNLEGPLTVSTATGDQWVIFGQKESQP